MNVLAILDYENGVIEIMNPPEGIETCEQIEEYLIENGYSITTTQWMIGEKLKLNFDLLNFKGVINL